MAGNARKSPPTTGPYFLAMSPARTVTVPPKTKRTRYSYHFVFRSADKCMVIRIFGYLRSTIHNPKEIAIHTGSATTLAGSARHRSRIMRRQAMQAYARKARAAANLPLGRALSVHGSSAQVREVRLPSAPTAASRFSLQRYLSPFRDVTLSTYGPRMTTIQAWKRRYLCWRLLRQCSSCYGCRGFSHFTSHQGLSTFC